MTWAAIQMLGRYMDAEEKPQMTKAERNEQIIARIKQGEKREMLALEFGISRNTVTSICKKAGLPLWSRFKRPTKIE